MSDDGVAAGLSTSPPSTYTPVAPARAATIRPADRRHGERFWTGMIVSFPVCPAPGAGAGRSSGRQACGMPSSASTSFLAADHARPVPNEPSCSPQVRLSGQPMSPPTVRSKCIRKLPGDAAEPALLL